MTKSIDLLRRELHAFCELAQRRGWTIAPDSTVNRYGKTCCPLGACRIVAGPVADFELLEVDAWGPRVTRTNPWHQFSRAFDGCVDVRGQYADLGREFRRHYVGGDQ